MWIKFIYDSKHVYLTNLFWYTIWIIYTRTKILTVKQINIAKSRYSFTGLVLEEPNFWSIVELSKKVKLSSTCYGDRKIAANKQITGPQLIAQNLEKNDLGLHVDYYHQVFGPKLMLHK